MKYLLLIVLLIPSLLNAQLCRYNERIFTTFTKTANVTYAVAPGIPSFYLGEGSTTSQTLKLDIFEPNGDTSEARALIIFAHPGGFINGSKNGDDMQSLCDSFVKRGYVTATMDYRLNFNLFSSSSSERAVWRGTQDASSAVRFFKTNAALYKIDTSKIFFWGSSAGSFMALNLAYLDDAERPTSTTTSPNLGCKDCSGTATPTHNSTIAGIISCWGAIKDTSWMNNNTVPTILFHGSTDGTVAFTHGSPFGLPTLPVVSGSQEIADHLTRKGKPYQFYPQIGQPHEYWGTSNGTFSGGGPTVYWQSIITDSKNFMLTTMGMPTTCSLLPLFYLNCWAKYSAENSVIVNWKTITSSNIKSFIVQFSLDGFTWNNAAEITADNNKLNYEFKHQLTSSYKIIYYRIKQISANQNFEYSNNVVVKNGTNLATVKAFPNPATQAITLTNIEFTNKQPVFIYDVVGKLIYQKQVSKLENKIDVSSLTNGIYFIKLPNQNEPVKFTVVK